MSYFRLIPYLCFFLIAADLRATQIPAGEDDEITKAITQAQQSFPKVWLDIEKERSLLLPEITTAIVKVWFFNQEEKDQGDYLWVKNFTYDPATKTFTGIITSDSKKTPHLEKGAPVIFPLAHLADWIVVRDEMAEGAFMVQVLRSRMDRDALRKYDKQFSFDFPEFQPQKAEANEL